MKQPPRMVVCLLALALGLSMPVRALGEDVEPFPTANFSVTAPTRPMAMRLGRAAEQLRKERAIEWFGAELPRWSTRCAIAMTTGWGPSYTDFKGRTPRQIILAGSLEHVTQNVLPHEITHAVLISNLPFEFPTWADEGAAVLSSSEADRERFDEAMRQLAAGRCLPLHRLFALGIEYPEDRIALYAQGYSLTRFLVAERDRPTFLAFVKDGQRRGWDHAVKKHYELGSVDALEKAWRTSLGEPVSWQGRRIFVARPGVKLRHTDARSKRVIETATLPEGVYTVLKESDDWIKVRHGTAVGWLEKEEVSLSDRTLSRLDR